MQNLQQALLSVSDFTGLVDFAQGLQKLNITLIATSGTANFLRNHQIIVTDVADYTGSPEILAGRVKTLHPKIHAGILARRKIDQAEMQQHAISRIDLVIVNLYPFQQVIQTPACDFQTAIENIDIGGPCLLRAAAKNHQDVIVIVDPSDYPIILNNLQNKEVSQEQRLTLAHKAFQHTASYDTAIANYFASSSRHSNLPSEFPSVYLPHYQKKLDLRYGENPQQKAALYYDVNQSLQGIAQIQQLSGKALSFNNIVDIDTGWTLLQGLTSPGCSIIKHANPCGVALGVSTLDAYHAAYACDPTSAFGGIIVFNRSLATETAEAIIKQQFVEVIVAPEIPMATLEIIKQKPNIRAIVYPNTALEKSRTWQPISIYGGLLLQESDYQSLASTQLRYVTESKPTAEEQADLSFAWHVCRFVKSNAIVFTKGLKTLGIGAGQMSRIDSTRIGLLKAADAGLSLAGATMASDAFFPFSDNIEIAAQAGISAIIQPGGSIRDADVIAKANALGIAMVFTGIRHFRH